MNELREFVLSKNKPISSCKDLYKHFIGRHKVIPVYLTPKFEVELECIMNKLEDLETKNKKYKEVINKAINYIEDNARYYSDEDEGLVFYIEEKEETFCNNLLDILKEVEDK